MEETVRKRRTTRPISHYWELVKDMEDNQMLELASLLVNYVRMHPAKANDDEERERGFRSLAGCWANDQGDDDMEAIIRQGRESRRGNRIVPSFDE